MSSNFDFLNERFPALANFGKLAEKYLYSDSNSSLIKLGMMGETIVNLIIKYDNIEVNDNATAADKIRILYMDDYITKEYKDILHVTRKYRNRAAHDNYEDVDKNKAILQLNHRIAEWFMQTYGQAAGFAGKFSKHGYLRYVDWSAKGAHPANLREKDYTAILNSKAFFARKITPESDGLLDLLDAQIGYPGQAM